MKVSRFEDLECWQEARQLTRKIYQAVELNNSFRRDLRLAGQLQGASSSIMANIAEGFMRRSDKELTLFLYTAMASAAEVQSHHYVALDVGYLNQDRFETLYGQASRAAKLTSGLIRYLRKEKGKS